MWLTGGRYPDWIADDVAMMRDCARYYCLPSELEEEDWHILARHRAIEVAEGQYRAAEARSISRGWR